MKIATWNVNSLTVRLPQLLDWLATHHPDAMVLQETKLTDDKFPHADELFLTEIDAEFGAADAHFPPFDKSAFTAVAREARVTAEGTGYAFVHYCRQP